MRKHRFLIIVILAILAALYLACVHYTEPTEIGIVRNLVTGELRLDTSGWNLTPPWVSVAHVDTRPMRVCVTSAGRGFHCKLVQFEPAAYRTFVVTEGFRYYWWSNRLSFNLGYDEEYRGVKDLLRGHAYGAQRYPFVTVLKDYEGL